jgi:hypothetical protein
MIFITNALQQLFLGLCAIRAYLARLMDAQKWAVEQASLIAQKGINPRQQKNVAGQIFTSMRHGIGM